MKADPRKIAGVALHISQDMTEHRGTCRYQITALSRFPNGHGQFILQPGRSFATMHVMGIGSWYGTR
jgi:hypothetical protein